MHEYKKFYPSKKSLKPSRLKTFRPSADIHNLFGKSKGNTPSISLKRYKGHCCNVIHTASIQRWLPHSYRYGTRLLSLLKFSNKYPNNSIAAFNHSTKLESLRSYDGSATKTRHWKRTWCLVKVISCWSKTVPHVEHDYYSSFSQSNLWFVALSLQFLSSFLKLPISCGDYEEFPDAIVIITNFHHFDCFDLDLTQTMVKG